MPTHAASSATPRRSFASRSPSRCSRSPNVSSVSSRFSLAPPRGFAAAQRRSARARCGHGPEATSPGASRQRFRFRRDHRGCGDTIAGRCARARPRVWRHSARACACPTERERGREACPLAERKPGHAQAPANRKTKGRNLASCSTNCEGFGAASPVSVPLLHSCGEARRAHAEETRRAATSRLSSAQQCPLAIWMSHTRLLPRLRQPLLRNMVSRDQGVKLVGRTNLIWVARAGQVAEGR